MNHKNFIKELWPLKPIAIAAMLTTAACSEDASSFNMPAQGSTNLDGFEGRNEVFVATSQARSLKDLSGQWANYHQRSADGIEMVQETRWVGVKNGAHWFEVTADGDLGEIRAKMLIDLENSAADRPQISEIYLSQGGGPLYDYTELGVEFLDLLLDSQMIHYRSVIAGDERQDLTVVAGTFQGAVVESYTLTDFLAEELSGTNYFHSAVPGAGLVLQENSNGATTELIAFGTSGAISMIDEKQAQPFEQLVDNL